MGPDPGKRRISVKFSRNTEMHASQVDHDKIDIHANILAKICVIFLNISGTPISDYSKKSLETISAKKVLYR